MLGFTKLFKLSYKLPVNFKNVFPQESNINTSSKSHKNLVQNLRKSFSKSNQRKVTDFYKNYHESAITADSQKLSFGFKTQIILYPLISSKAVACTTGQCSTSILSNSSFCMSENEAPLWIPCNHNVKEQWSNG